MHPDTHLVIQLQSLDQKIAALEKEVAALPKHIATIEKALESHNRKLEADRAALSANQKDRKKLEGDIQVHQQKISKLKDQMLGAKTNEQYKAFQHEIEYTKLLSPAIWKSGMKVSVVEREVRFAMPRLTAFQKCMPWVMMAPLGRPVVPEVYMMVTMSSWVAGTKPSSGAAAASAAS